MDERFHQKKNGRMIIQSAIALDEFMLFFQWQWLNLNDITIKKRKKMNPFNFLGV